MTIQEVASAAANVVDAVQKFDNSANKAKQDRNTADVADAAAKVAEAQRDADKQNMVEMGGRFDQALAAFLAE